MTEQTDAWLTEVRSAFLQQRRLAERAIDQLSADDLFRSAGAGDNSIAVLMKHVGGNLRSRWTEPFTTDGEKPDRNRDGEFEVADDDVASIRRTWDAGWAAADATLAALESADSGRSVSVRGEDLPLPAALLRSLAHTAQHVGQIVLLAKRWRADDWETLSIPRGRSDEYLRRPPQQ